MKKSKTYKFLVFWCTMILVFSMITVAAGAFVPDEELDSELGDVVLIERTGTEEISMLNELDVEIVDRYGMYTLIDVGEESIETLEHSGLEVNNLPNQSEINVKGNTIDVFEEDEGLPIESAVEEDTIGSDLEIDSYESGEEGIYLINTLGPINPEWVETLEGKGLEIINYVPNYAYEVEMTPEQAEDVEDLFFVDWVGVYQPSYKIHPETEPGAVTVRLRPGFEPESLSNLEYDIDILGEEDLQEDGYNLIGEVDTVEELENLALENDVYYISPYVEPELHGEMDIQQIGGGLWFMDDEYETRTDLDPEPREGDPQEPYRKHGDYGAYINQLGYSGGDITVAVADTGVGDGTVGDAGVEDFTGRVIDGYGFGPDEDYWGDGVYHGTACTGLIAGDTHRGTGETWDEYQDGNMPYYMGQGLAYESEIFATKIFDDASGFMPDEFYPIVEEPAQRSDAYVHSNSWGASTLGVYSDSDEIFDQAVRDADRSTDENREMVITTSAGNDGGRGDQTIGSPANAKNVITVGGNQPYNLGLGYENPENMFGSSSRGWTEDNRVKPDLIAPSEAVISQNTPLEGGGYIAASGTSFGNPLVAGAAGIVVEWYEENYGETPSPAMVKSILINTANELDSDVGDTRGPVPNRDEGWGVPDISKLEYPTENPLDFRFEDQENLLTTGEEAEYNIEVDDYDEPLKITLTWTDKHAMEGDSEGGTPTLKNNLDLEVQTPGGEYIRGNAFDLSGDGESDDGFTYPEAEVMADFDYNENGWDDVNNVQNVYISPEELESGTYTITVKGTNVPADANNDGEPNQDYALTVFNSYEIPPKDGELELDREEYSGDDTVYIRLTDYDLMAEGSYEINVTSMDSEGYELDEEWVTLYEDEDDLGFFEGSIDVTENPEEDGALYVEHDGEITAWYLDEDPGYYPENEINKDQSSFGTANIQDTSSTEVTLPDGEDYLSEGGMEYTIAESEGSDSDYEEINVMEPGSLEDGGSTKSSTEIPRPDGNYEKRDPIEIHNNTDFHNQADEEGWPGDGSEDDPYIIKGYEIDGDGHDTGVYVSDTTVYFELRDNYVHSSADAGIRLDNVLNGIIVNNTVSNNDGYGIFTGDSSNNNILVDNILDSNDPGWKGSIQIDDGSHNNTLEGNTVTNSGGRGLTIENSNYNTVKENYFSNNDDHGIELRGDNSYNTLEGNTASNNNNRGISSGGDNNIIKNNTLTGNGWQGIDIRGSENNIYKYNTMSNNRNAAFISSGVENVIFKHNTLTNNNDYGIGIRGVNNTISHNIISDNNNLGVDFGFDDDHSNTFKYNIVRNHTEYGLWVNDPAVDNLFYRNMFINNDIHALDNFDNDWHAGDPAEDGYGGNYWDDYDEVIGGEDRGDGIGDESYFVPPGTNEDKYPWLYEVPGRFEHDVGVLDIYPSGVAPNETVEVEVLIANLGQHDEEDVPISYEIGREDEDETWSDTIYIDIEAEEFKWVTFENWTPPEEDDDYYHNVTTNLEGDQNPDNTYMKEWFEVRDVHDVGFSDIIHPEENEPNVEVLDSEWEWVYPHDHRPRSIGATSYSTESTWYAGMVLDVEDRTGEFITDVAYYDNDDEGDWTEAKIATVEYEYGQPVVGEFVGSSEEYDPRGIGWTELDIEEPVEIEEEEEYWVLMHVHDVGSGNFPIGQASGVVEEGGWYTDPDGDPTDPEHWRHLRDSMIPGSWQIEARITDYTWGPEYDIADGTVFNETQPVEGIVENFGNKHETDVPVEAKITCNETGEIKYEDDSIVDSIERDETAVATFEDWDPSGPGYYNVNMTTMLENDENPENDYYEQTIYVVPIEIDFEATSIDAPEEPMYQYEEKEVKGTITNIGNYYTNTEVQMTIERINENILVDEDFSDGLPEGWTIDDLDGYGYTWEFDEDDETMKVSSGVDSQNDILWTDTIDATDATHRFMVEFYSEFEGDVSRDLRISTDGGETSQRVKTNIGEGEISYDLVDWVAGEDEVMIGWEFFTEEAEEGEYWLIDDVKVTGEYLEEPEYEEEAASDELYPRKNQHFEFVNWMPSEDDLPSDYLFTFETIHEEDENLESSIVTERMFVDYNLPPEAPTDPSPEDGEEDVSHSPEFSAYVSDPNERDMDVTFYLLNETGEEEIANETARWVESDSRASITFPMYLEPESTYQWYVEVTDGDETTVSDTWTFHTYEPEPVWKTASARINAVPPEPVENLHVDWDADVWEVEANELTWEASPDDGAGEDDTDHYVIYRSDSEDGPWDESTKIDTVDADGSEDYTYMDEGMADDGVQWHYVVRAVDRQDNMENNEDYVVEKPVPTATDPIPEDGANVEELEQTVSVDVNSPTGEPLEVEFYHSESETYEVIAEFDNITDERVETEYIELKEEDMDQDHYWFVVASYEDYNVGSINPDPEDSEKIMSESDYEGEWRWLYDHEHRPPADGGVGLSSPGNWFGAIILDLSDDVGDHLTDVSYYDREEAGEWAQAMVAEDDDGVPGEWLAQSEEYTPSGEGWVELELDEPVEIEEPGEYWIIIHLDDFGGGYHPFGYTSPYVENGQHVNLGDPHDPGDWDTLEEYGIGGAWSLEAFVATDVEVEPMGWSFYLKDTVPPEADAGEDIEAYQGDTVTLNGSDSTDNVEVVEWKWTIEDPTGEDTVLYGETVEYKLKYALDYDVELTVYDEAGNSDTDAIEIYAIDTEDPVADAGHSDYTRVGLDYSFDGSGSTDNVEIVNYTWTIEGISGVAEGYEETVYGETVDYKFLYAGTYNVELEVSDAEGNSDTDKVSVVVHPALEAYEITWPEEDYQTIDKDTVTVQWEGHEYMGDLTYEIRLNYGDWDEIGTDTEYTFVGLEDGTHVVQVRATHENGEKYTETRIFEIDTIEEELTIIEPENGVESLTYEEEFTIVGQTDPDLTVYVNDEEVDVDGEGEFEYDTTLIEGQNVFRVVAQYEEETVAETTVYALYLPQISEMQDQIDDLEDQVDANRDAIEDLENLIDQLENDLEDLEDELYTEINSLQGQIDDLQTEIDDVQTQIDDLEDKHEAELEDLQAQIHELETELEAAEEELENLQERVEELEEDEEETPGFTLIPMVLIAAVLAVAIYYKKVK